MRGTGRRLPGSFLYSRSADPRWRCRSSSSSSSSSSSGSGSGGGSPGGDRGPGSDAPIAPARAVYQGAYGTFSIGPEDEQEVLLYRLGINTAAACALACSSVAFLPEGSAARTAVLGNLDVLVAAGTAGLGLSLVQIHIYMAPIKRALQALWAVGAAGTVGIMLMQDPPVALFVTEHPAAVWLVGPMFAALTGVAFKEGLCYGKLEAALLFGATPLLLLGHLTGLLPETGERALLAVFCGLLAVFALRKWTQPVKDDVGDKSVFDFLALPPDAQQAAQAARQAREGRM